MHDQIEPPLPTENHILNSLPAEDFERLLPYLKKVHLTLGQILYRPEEPIKSVYFPDNAMISVLATTSDGQCAEVGVVGREGAAGIDVLMGVDSTSHECIVQIADGATMISTEAIRREFKLGGRLHDLLLRYMHAMMMQISQTALCNRLHSIEQRLARWLLMCHDRSAKDELTLTQDFLSIMLGVNRPTVTTAALILQGGGFIKYSRGKITITDREGLEEFACDCYSVVKPEYDRLALN
jgi:CRP-like cAMP-binding protein